HRAFALADAVRGAEWRDALLVIDDGKGARPVGAPQAAIDAPGIEHARQGIPDVGIRIGLLRQRAGATDLDDRVLALGKLDHLGQVTPRLGRRGRYTRLQKADVVDDEARIGVAIDQRRAAVEVAPAV